MKTPGSNPDVAEIIALAHSDELLRHNPACSTSSEWDVTTDMDIALKHHRGEIEHELLLQDVRSQEMRIYFRELAPDIRKSLIYFMESVHDALWEAVHRRKDIPLELLDEAGGDLIDLLLIRGGFGKSNPFWEQMFRVYKSGGCAVGWNGPYPGGRLVVYCPPQGA